MYYYSFRLDNNDGTFFKGISVAEYTTISPLAAGVTVARLAVTNGWALLNGHKPKVKTSVVQGSAQSSQMFMHVLDDSVPGQKLHRFFLLPFDGSTATVSPLAGTTSPQTMSENQIVDAVINADGTLQTIRAAVAYDPAFFPETAALLREAQWKMLSHGG
ncbi:MAG: hypothetical protein ACFCVE_16035 [Phycisphaerae bacterium]